MNHILIGAARAQKLPALVCEYSIRRQTKMDVSVLHSYAKPAPEPLSIKNRSRTGFSFVRFTLPERAGFNGMGCYLDSDMILRADIAELFALWQAPVTVTGNLPAVLVVDCKAVPWKTSEILENLDEGVFSYEKLMSLNAFGYVARTIPNCWNSLDACPEGAKILHFTDMGRQCWRVRDHRPVSALWRKELEGALSSGFISKAVLDEEIAAGYIHRDTLKP